MEVLTHAAEDVRVGSLWVRDGTGCPHRERAIEGDPYLFILLIQTGWPTAPRIARGGNTSPAGHPSVIAEATRIVAPLRVVESAPNPRPGLIQQFLKHLTGFLKDHRSLADFALNLFGAHHSL